MTPFKTLNKTLPVYLTFTLLLLGSTLCSTIQKQKNEVKDFNNDRTIKKDDFLYPMDDNGKILKTPFTFDPNKWNLVTSFNKNNGKEECMIFLKYKLEQKVNLVKPLESVYPRVNINDYVMYLEKKEYVIQNIQLLIPDNKVHMARELCELVDIVGIKKIREYLEKKLKEKSNYETNSSFRDFWKVDLRFTEVLS
jgi:hypothetical protein